MKAWTHATLYEALAAAGLENATNGRGEPKAEPYVWLFEQRPNCAVLYRPRSAAYGLAPLHVNESRRSWRPSLWTKIRGVLIFDESERDSNGFLRCGVSASGGWAAIAQALIAEGVQLRND